MKLSLLDVKNISEPIKKLINQDLPIRLSWKILGITEVFDPVVKKIEDFRVDLVKKYGEDVFEVVNISDSKTYVLTKAEFESHKKDEFTSVMARVEILDRDKANLFLEEFNKLLLLEEDFSIEKINLDEFEGNIKLSPQDLFYMKKIFV